MHDNPKTREVDHFLPQKTSLIWTKIKENAAKYSSTELDFLKLMFVKLFWNYFDNIICFRCDLCGTLAEGFFTIRERSNAADKVRNAELRNFGRKKCVRIEQIIEQPDTDSSELSDFPDRSRTKRSCSVRRIFENSRRREIEIVGQDFRIWMFRTNLDVPRWSDLSGSLSGSSDGRLFNFRSKKFEKSNKLFLFGYCHIILYGTLQLVWFIIEKNVLDLIWPHFERYATFLKF